MRAAPFKKKFFLNGAFNRRLSRYVRPSVRVRTRDDREWERSYVKKGAPSPSPPGASRRVFCAALSPWRRQRLRVRVIVKPPLCDARSPAASRCVGPPPHWCVRTACVFSSKRGEPNGRRGLRPLTAARSAGRPRTGPVASVSVPHGNGFTCLPAVVHIRTHVRACTNITLTRAYTRTAESVYCIVFTIVSLRPFRPGSYGRDTPEHGLSRLTGLFVQMFINLFIILEIFPF